MAREGIKYEKIESWEDVDNPWEDANKVARILFHLLKNLANELGYDLVKPEGSYYYDELTVRPNNAIKYMKGNK